MTGSRKSKAAGSAQPRQTLVLDTGGFTLKAGLVSEGAVGPARVVPNCIARDRARKLYVGSQLDNCRDMGEMQFRRPVDKGYIVNWEAQKEIWDHELFDEKAPLRCDPSETRLVLTEPPNSLPALQTHCDQVVFEEYGFSSYYRGLGPVFNAYHDIQGIFRTPKQAPTVSGVPADVVLVIDSGYSHTTVTPVLRGQPLQSAIRRLDVGGKLLTNYLTRLVSLRHFDVRNESYIVNDMKEAVCYVSADFGADLEKSWKGTRGQQPRMTAAAGNPLFKDYVLPDFHTTTRGIVRDYDPARHSKARKLAASGQTDEDVLTLRNERFLVPELIFNPSDVGIRQPGIADLVRQSLDQLPIGLWPAFLANVIVVGGNSLFEGFVPRLQKELVQRFPDDCVVRVARPADPITSTWHGAANLSNLATMDKLAVTKQEYDELGAALVARRMTAAGAAPS